MVCQFDTYLDVFNLEQTFLCATTVYTWLGLGGSNDPSAEMKQTDGLSLNSEARRSTFVWQPCLKVLVQQASTQKVLCMYKIAAWSVQLS